MALPHDGQGSPYEPGSCNSSTMGLTPLSMGRSGPVPEQWTLVHEWNMERRQQREIDPYMNWRFDVQSQIANIGNKLNKSLQEHPPDKSAYVDSYGKRFEEKREQLVKDQTRSVANSLAYGLGRT